MGHMMNGDGVGSRSWPDLWWARVLGTALIVLCGCLAGDVEAQTCGGQWLPTEGVSGVGLSDNVLATTMWDPDGAGPQSAKLVIGGTFALAGNVEASRIAMFDTQTSTWSALGTGVNSNVLALAALPNGDLIAGGFFTAAGGMSANYVARWNGTTWSALGEGVNGAVYELAVLPNGDLIAGGDFLTAGGVIANGIARWNGTTWSQLGTGVGPAPGSSSLVYSLAVLPNGDLIAGGYFATAGGVSANRIAQWNGTTWSALGTGMDASVEALAVLPNGDLVAAGSFLTAGGVSANRIAQWNGATWSALGTGLQYSSQAVRALAVLPNGDLVAGGNFTMAGGVSANRIARWNGTTWSSLGTGMGATRQGHAEVHTITILPNGDLMAGGHFSAAGGAGVSGISRWDGTTWSALGTGVSGTVYALATRSSGQLIAGGQFEAAGGEIANSIAQSDGTTWSAFGTGMRHYNVHAVAVLPNGDLVAGGDFLTAGAVSANRIARWDGTTWSALEAGLTTNQYPFNARVYCLAVLPNGELIAGGYFTTAGEVSAYHIARWNGTTWFPLGAGMDGAVYALAVLPNGDLIAGGRFTFAGGVSVNNVARWNGTTWSALGSGLDPGNPWNSYVSSIAVLPNEDLIVGGNFVFAGTREAPYIARWNGMAWSALGTRLAGRVLALAASPNGELVASSFFNAGGVNMNRISRWNGTIWSELGTGMNGSVYALAFLPNGDVVAGGDFTTTNGFKAPYFARYSMTGTPVATMSPSSHTVDSGQNVTISASVANGYSNVTYQWTRNGVNIRDGVNGASPGGGLVSGSNGAFSSPTIGSVATLTIERATWADSGEYLAVFTNACGSATSQPAEVVVTAGCIADVNQDGGIDGTDVEVFFTAWEAGTPTGDVNRDGGVDGADLPVFFDAWEAGGC